MNILLSGQLQFRFLGPPVLVQPVLRRHRMSPAQQEFPQAHRHQGRRSGPRQVEALPARRQIRTQMQIRAGLFSVTIVRFVTAETKAGRIRPDRTA